MGMQEIVFAPKAHAIQWSGVASESDEFSGRIRKTSGDRINVKMLFVNEHGHLTMEYSVAGKAPERAMCSPGRFVVVFLGQIVAHNLTADEVTALQR